MMADHDEHIENRGPVVLAVTTALLAVSTMFVALRLVSRAGVVRKVSQDDYFIVLAWVGIARFAAFNCRPLMLVPGDCLWTLFLHLLRNVAGPGKA